MARYDSRLQKRHERGPIQRSINTSTRIHHDETRPRIRIRFITLTNRFYSVATLDPIIEAKLKPVIQTNLSSLRARHYATTNDIYQTHTAAARMQKRPYRHPRTTFSSRDMKQSFDPSPNACLSNSKTPTQSNAKQHFKAHPGDEEETNKVWSWKRHRGPSTCINSVRNQFTRTSCPQEKVIRVKGAVQLFKYSTSKRSRSMWLRQVLCANIRTRANGSTQLSLFFLFPFLETIR